MKALFIRYKNWRIYRTAYNKKWKYCAWPPGEGSLLYGNTLKEIKAKITEKVEEAYNRLLYGGKG